jgi:hypothetical protein
MSDDEQHSEIEEQSEHDEEQDRQVCELVEIGVVGLLQI